MSQADRIEFMLLRLLHPGKVEADFADQEGKPPRQEYAHLPEGTKVRHVDHGLGVVKLIQGFEILVNFYGTFKYVLLHDLEIVLAPKDKVQDSNGSLGTIRLIEGKSALVDWKNGGCSWIGLDKLSKWRGDQQKWFDLVK